MHTGIIGGRSGRRCCSESVDGRHAGSVQRARLRGAQQAPGAVRGAGVGRGPRPHGHRLRLRSRQGSGRNGTTRRPPGDRPRHQPEVAGHRPPPCGGGRRRRPLRVRHRDQRSGRRDSLARRLRALRRSCRGPDLDAGPVADSGQVHISFGPPWCHPLGGHLFSVFPWAHLLFTEHALLQWRAGFKHDGATRFGEGGSTR